jgi:hypothetical protein
MNFEQHNSMEREACSFVMKMLQNIKRDLPYADLSRNAPTQPLAFQSLKTVSNYIQDHAASFAIKLKHNFDEAFQSAVAEGTMLSLMSGKMRDGIVDLVWRLHEGVRFAESQTKSASTEPDHIAELHTCLLKLQRNDESSKDESSKPDPDHIAQTQWTTNVTEWRTARDAWTQYLRLFDSVVPEIFFDIPTTLASLIEKYPKVFWAEFWKHIACCNVVTEFRRYLIYTVAPQLLSVAPQTRSCCQEMLQGLIRYLERTGQFGSIMSYDPMCEALIETGVALFPLSSSVVFPWSTSVAKPALAVAANDSEMQAFYH